MKPFWETQAGQVYQSIESMITTPLSAIILIVVGYGLHFEKTVMKTVVKAMIIRIVFQAVLAVILMFVVRKMMPDEPLMMAAVLIFASGPSSYSTPAFAKNEEGVVFTSTIGSCYMIVTIVVFAITAAVFSGCLN